MEKLRIFLVICFIQVFTQSPVPSLKLPYYVGRWYQMYSNKVVADTSQRHGMCVIADYRIKSNNSLFSYNSFHKYGPMGKIYSFDGEIVQPYIKVPGNMLLKLKKLPYPTPYVVIKVGPIINSQYQYAVVTDNNNASLYIYAKSIKTFHKLYEEEALKFSYQYGFSSYYNKPLPTPQPAACDYPPSPKEHLIENLKSTENKEIVCETNEDECMMRRLIEEYSSLS